MTTIRLSRYAKIFYSFLAASAVSCPIAASAQDLYVSEYLSSNGLNSIKKVAPNGTVSIFKTGVNAPFGIAFDPSGNFYTADYFNGNIQKRTSGGVITTFASGFGEPIASIAFDPSGNLYAATYSSNSIKKIAPNGTVSTFASGLSGVFGLAFDGSGNLFEAGLRGTSINKITPSGVVSTFVTGLNSVVGLAFDSSGNLYEADSLAGSIKKISPNGTVSNFATGLRQGYEFGPDALAFDPNGNLFVSAPSSTFVHGLGVTGSIYEITPGGVVSTLSNSTNAFGLAFAPSISTSSPTSVPEPFTIIGTLIGGTAAFRMRKKLTAIAE